MERPWLLEAPLGGVSVTSGGHEHVDDLAELVDRAAAIAPPAGDLDGGLIDLPAVTDLVSAWPGGLGEQRGEPLDPPVDGGVVDLDAALGEEFFDVAVRQRQAQAPAHRQHDDVGREAEASEGRPWEGGPEAATHDISLAARAPSQQMQQSPWMSLTAEGFGQRLHV